MSCITNFSLWSATLPVIIWEHIQQMKSPALSGRRSDRLDTRRVILDEIGVEGRRHSMSFHLSRFPREYCRSTCNNLKISVGCDRKVWSWSFFSFTWLSDANKIVWMIARSVEAVFAVIEVIAYFTFEASTDNRSHETIVARDLLMMGRQNLHFRHTSNPVGLLRKLHGNLLIVFSHRWNRHVLE